MPETNHWNEPLSQAYEQFRAHGSSLITHIYPELKKLGLFHKNMTTLSIGPGGGWLEVVLAMEYQAQLTLVEPSANFVAEFQQQIVELQLQKQVVEICIDKFENFHTSQKYDLITAIHAWHYIGYDVAQLKKAIAMIAPGGVFCIAQTSEHAFSKELKDLLYPTGHFFIDIEPLSRYCFEQGLDHQIISISKIVPLQRYIENNRLTEYGKSWLSLMGRIDYQHISPQIIDKAIEIIKHFSKDDRLDDAWGVILLRAQ